MNKNNLTFPKIATLLGGRAVHKTCEGETIWEIFIPGRANLLVSRDADTICVRNCHGNVLHLVPERTAVSLAQSIRDWLHCFPGAAVMVLGTEVINLLANLGGELDINPEGGIVPFAITLPSGKVLELDADRSDKRYFLVHRGDKYVTCKYGNADKALHKIRTKLLGEVDALDSGTPWARDEMGRIHDVNGTFLFRARDPFIAKIVVKAVNKYCKAKS